MSSQIFSMPRDPANGVRILSLAPSGTTATMLRPSSGSRDGGAVMVRTKELVRAGERVDVEMESKGRRIVVSGVIREIHPTQRRDENVAHILVVRTHAHRMRQMIQAATEGVQRSWPSVVEEVATLRVRGTADLLDAMEVPRGTTDGGRIELAWRGAREPGQIVLVEISFGPSADEIGLAGRILEVVDHPRRSIPIARIEFDASQRRRAAYVREVLSGMREATARAHRRYDLQIAGRWWRGARAEQQVFQQISRGGAFVPAVELPPIGAELPIELHDREQGAIRVPAQVMWVSRDPGRSGFGTRFRITRREVADAINRFLEREAEPQSRPAWA